MNIIEAMFEEMNRARELIKQYEGVGAAGNWGKQIIGAVIKRSEAAISRGDVEEMLKLYNELKNLK